MASAGWVKRFYLQQTVSEEIEEISRMLAKRQNEMKYMLQITVSVNRIFLPNTRTSDIDKSNALRF